MFKRVFLFILIVSCGPERYTPLAPSKIEIDKYYGIAIKDPYRNLENLKDVAVIKWLRKQEEHSSEILSLIPNRDYLFEKQKKYDEKENSNISKTLITDLGTYFYLKQRSVEEIPKLYYRSYLNLKKEICLYDPLWHRSKSGFLHTITYFKPNWDETKVAIGLAKEGEEVSEIIIIDIKTKKVSSEIITNTNPASLGGISWLPDNSGIIYQHIPRLNITERDFMLNTKSAVYKLGEDSKKINSIFSKSDYPQLTIKEEDYPIVSYKSNKDKYVLGILDGDSRYKDVYYANIDEVYNGKPKWEQLFRKEDKIKDFVFYEGDIIFLSGKNASNYKICRTPVSAPNFINPEVLVKEKKNQLILDFEVTPKGIYFTTLKNGVTSRLSLLDTELREKEITLPKASGASYLESDGKNLYVSVRGWTTPYSLYSYNLDKKTFSKPIIFSENVDSEFVDLVVQETEIVSHDGVLIPISIIHQRNIKKNGINSTLILGYGAYGASFTPFFSIPLLTWVMEGGVLVVPHVRGGGEKGDLWHKGGYKTSKPNTWKDAISCAEYLIERGYTSKNKTVIYGVSAGGIMVGRAITERPDLFAVAIADVPAMNMIRSEIQPNGPNSIKEFGSTKDSIEFRALLEMDSYHNIKDKSPYPATFITTGIKDSKVVAWDPAKFVARLQAANTSDKPILLSVDFNAGHGVNYVKEKYYKDMADVLSFAFWQTGHPDYQPKKSF